MEHPAGTPNKGVCIRDQRTSTCQFPTNRSPGRACIPNLLDIKKCGELKRLLSLEDQQIKLLAE